MMMKKGFNTIESAYMKNSSIFFLAVLVIIAAIFIPSFFQLSNFEGLLKQSAVPAIAAMAMNFILVGRGLDLSMGYICGMVSTIAGVLMKIIGMPVLPALIISLGCAALFGLFNGLTVAYLHVPPFVSTLGSGYIAYGIAQIVAASHSLNKLPADFYQIGNLKIIGTLPLMVFYSLLIVLGGWFIMTKTSYGRQLEAIGSNIEAARLSGVNIAKLQTLPFVFSGFFAGLCGIFLSMRTGAAAPTLGGPSFSFEAVTACVLGGTSLKGGSASILGGFVGVLIVKIIENCINLLNISPYVYDAVLSVIVFLAILADAMKKRTVR